MSILGQEKICLCCIDGNIGAGDVLFLHHMPMKLLVEIVEAFFANPVVLVGGTVCACGIAVDFDTAKRAVIVIPAFAVGFVLHVDERDI